MRIYYIFFVYTIRDENIVTKRFKSKTEWLTYLKKLKILGAPRRIPPSPLEPVRYGLFDTFGNYVLSLNLCRKEGKNH